MDVGRIDIAKINNQYMNKTVDAVKGKAQDDAFEKRLEKAMTDKDDKELKKVCQEFEGVMLSMMYKQMRTTVPKSELIQDDVGKDIFSSMLDDKLVDEASSRGIGLGDILYKQLHKQLDATYKPTSREDIAPSVENK